MLLNKGSYISIVVTSFCKGLLTVAATLIIPSNFPLNQCNYIKYIVPGSLNPSNYNVDDENNVKLK